ncbi:solute carrier family 35 member F6 isoform X3 [Balaenoptera acutorostrata]|uniref:Solute carrier family 35 member F6 isoform X3 n=1 Tax=Balaenoptera acutorostrata TaxID=9767 RepID=A0A384AVD0_BALAC|nr:solute carrier family 35 member F6 isoform X3 [Balaenoptera acutorostrata]
MAWTKYQLFLAGLMLVTGSINTLSAKWADNFVAPGCGGSQEHSFQHPFLQAVGMFLGEFSCLAAFYLLWCRAAGHPDTSADPQQPFNPLLFLPPALCDMTGTSIMYVALNMTSASSFQMLRGAVIIFTGLFSVTFLGRRLALSQWLGILATIAGLVVVGLADLLSKHDSQHKLSEVITGVAGVGIPGLPCTESLDKAFYELCCPPSPEGGHVGHQLMWTCTCSRGDLLIIMAQIIVSIQMVLEEKFVYKHNVHPLRAVGTEGLFGFVILSLLLVPMYYIPAGSFSGNPRGTLEDALDAFCQASVSPRS